MTAEVTFEIPDEWWNFAEMQTFSSHKRGSYYPYSTTCKVEDIEVVPISDVEPPRRSAGIPLFKKYKLVPILFALSSPECALPPVEVVKFESERFRFKLHNGLHRYYASLAAGYINLPVITRCF